MRDSRARRPLLALLFGTLISVTACAPVAPNAAPKDSTAWQGSIVAQTSTQTPPAQNPVQTPAQTPPAQNPVQTPAQTPPAQNPVGTSPGAIPTPTLLLLDTAPITRTRIPVAPAPTPVPQPRWESLLTLHATSLLGADDNFFFNDLAGPVPLRALDVYRCAYRLLLVNLDRPDAAPVELYPFLAERRAQAASPYDELKFSVTGGVVNLFHEMGLSNPERNIEFISSVAIFSGSTRWIALTMHREGSPAIFLRFPARLRLTLEERCN